MIRTHTVTLESTHGREIATAHSVHSAELVACVRRFMTSREAEACAIPIVFVDGKGYTNWPDFQRMVRTVNEASTRCGGAQVF